MRARTLFAVLTLVPAAFLECRREKPALRPGPDVSRGGLDFPAPPRGAAAFPGATPRVIVLGLDGADWRILDEFISRGRMPNLARLARTGAARTLRSFVPTLSPIVWTTLATGLDPSVHGVLDFRERDPVTGLSIPVSGLSREVPAIWNVATAKGLTVGIVGWWATYPAEEVEGFLLSDRLSSFFGQPLPASQATVFPPSAASFVATVEKGVEASLSTGEIARFLDVPPAEIERRLKEDRTSDPVVGSRGVLRSTALLGRAGLELYDRARPQLFCLYIQGTDEIAHDLAAYAPPPLAGISAEDRARFGRGVEAYYCWVDELIGAVAARAARDRADVLVLSDHGFKWAQERPSPSSHASTDFRTASFWHRLDGVLLGWGPDVAADPSRKTASVFDIAPTLCALLGLPPDPRMEGQVLEGMFRPGTLRPQAAEDWGRIAHVRRAAALPVSAAETDRSVQKLLSLGYISPSQARPAAREAGSAGDLRTSAAWNNLGLYWKEQGRWVKAREAILRARSMAPSEYGPPLNLSEVDRAAGRDEESAQMLIEAGRLGYPDFVGLVLLRVREDVSSGHAARARALLERTAVALPGETRLLPVLGRLQLQSRACAAAEATFERYLDRHPDDFDAWNADASAALCRGDRAGAIARFRKSLRIRADQPRVEEVLRRLSAAGPP